LVGRRTPQSGDEGTNNVSEIEQEIAEEMGDDQGVPEGIDPETGEIIEHDGEPEAASEAAPAPRSQKEIEASAKKLEAEAERHAKRVAEIMGDDFSLLVPSPVDWTPGFIFNVPEMHPAPEQVAELHAIVGQSAPLELRDAEDAEGCEKCNALGEVLTGSRKPGQETKPCTACTGTGWRTKALPLAQVSPIDYSVNANTTGTLPPNQPIAADRWGRQYGHPHYGLEPAQVGV
jgi:hypothetical protein